MSLSVIILAAGKGTRMKSDLPKVMHCIAGKPMVEHVYDRSRELDAETVHIVYGHGGDKLKQYCASFTANWVQQSEQLGTAHAVQQASPTIDDNNIVLVLYGDVPLIKTCTLQQLVAKVSGDNIALLTVNLADPTGYGRIIRDANEKVVAIVEHKDADDSQKKINEANTGILAVRAGYLNDCLGRIGNDNAQGEYYLTDLVEIAVQDGNKVFTAQPETEAEVEGINDRIQLAKIERIKQTEIAKAIMADGVTITDPARIDIRGSLKVGSDSSIDVGCTFEGEVSIASGVTIGAGCVISNSTIASNSIIKPYSVIEDAVIDANTQVGPFARIRPGTHLCENSRVGNFVEIKKAEIEDGAKVNHLTYVGDARVGPGANIGAGTITCNYDGYFKHQTVIGANCFVGSNSSLIAPVTLGAGSYIGSGSVISEDVPDDALALTRPERRTFKRWAARYRASQMKKKGL